MLPPSPPQSFGLQTSLVGGVLSFAHAERDPQTEASHMAALLQPPSCDQWNAAYGEVPHIRQAMQWYGWRVGAPEVPTIQWAFVSLIDMWTGIRQRCQLSDE